MLLVPLLCGAVSEVLEALMFCDVVSVFVSSLFKLFSADDTIGTEFVLVAVTDIVSVVVINSS